VCRLVEAGLQSEAVGVVEREGGLAEQFGRAGGGGSCAVCDAGGRVEADLRAAGVQPYRVTDGGQQAQHVGAKLFGLVRGLDEDRERVVAEMGGVVTRRCPATELVGGVGKQALGRAAAEPAHDLAEAADVDHACRDRRLRAVRVDACQAPIDMVEQKIMCG
jgi:hypothetical protein